MYTDPEQNLQELVANLPALVNLDLSGTNLAGLEPLDDQGEVKENSCPIPGLEGRHFDFLGLLNCAEDASRRRGIPATKVRVTQNCLSENTPPTDHKFVDRKIRGQTFSFAQPLTMASTHSSWLIDIRINSFGRNSLFGFSGDWRRHRAADCTGVSNLSGKEDDASAFVGAPDQLVRTHLFQQCGRHDGMLECSAANF